MKDKKVVFMGTPDFSAPVLKKLIEVCNVVGVVTQPDAIVGRKKILTKSPVKIIAEENKIKVLQPDNLRKDYKEIIDLNPDIIITCAYGQILPKELLEFPEYKTINVHASLLPELRGGAPIQWALIKGLEKTGITIMETSKGLDEGDIIEKEELNILEDDNYGTLTNKLSEMGANLLIKILPDIFSNNITKIKQEASLATYAPIIKREDEQLDFNKTMKEVINHIRALYPQPGAFAIMEEVQMKIYKATYGENICGENGEIVEIYSDGIGISVKDGEVIIKELQFPGKRILTTKEYLNGVNKDELLGKILR